MVETIKHWKQVKPGDICWDYCDNEGKVVQIGLAREMVVRYPNLGLTELIEYGVNEETPMVAVRFPGIDNDGPILYVYGDEGAWVKEDKSLNRGCCFYLNMPIYFV